MRREWRRTSSSQAEPSPWRHCWTSWASCSNETQPRILKSFSKAPELPRSTTFPRRLPSLALAPLEWPFELPTDWAPEWLSRPATLWNVNCHQFVPRPQLHRLQSVQPGFPVEPCRCRHPAGTGERDLGTNIPFSLAYYQLISVLCSVVALAPADRACRPYFGIDFPPRLMV